MKRRTILIGLNEINFEFLDYYISKGELQNFKSLFQECKRVETESESEYHLLEPWIQWVTIYTGKPYAEHGVYRLGDISEADHLSQIFEELESAGKRIGAISPFNAANRLKDSPFFIPDPWTETKVSGPSFAQKLYKAIHQAVNDNAKEKLTFSSIMTLASALLFYAPISRWPGYLKNLLDRKKPGTKAIILDRLLADVFIKLDKKTRPDFSYLFLNSGAHIQHHYMYNSDAYQGKLKNPEWYCESGYDPFIKVLRIYDDILGRVRAMKDVKVFIATGLHQQPHDELTYYWRLDDHKAFMKQLGIDNYTGLLPRMSRDFLIEFATSAHADEAAQILASLKCKEDDEAIFEVDNRGKSLFLELVYPNALEGNENIVSSIRDIEIPNFKSLVSFVAIKNGEHNGIGYLISDDKLELPDRIPLSQVKEVLRNAVLQDSKISV